MVGVSAADPVSVGQSASFDANPGGDHAFGERLGHPAWRVTQKTINCRTPAKCPAILG
jgi:hypothetical protein